MAKKIVIIGAGEIGKAIHHVLSTQSDLELILWSRSSAQPVSEIIPLAEIVFLCVPSWAMAEVIGTITPYLQSETVLVSLAKGMAEKTMDQLLREPFALLAGPMLSEELMQDLPGSATVATTSSAVFDTVSRLFSNTTIAVEHSTHVREVALASVLKNVYALGLGIAQAQKKGDNYKGWYIHKAVGEIAQICHETAYSLAGLGDLVATGFSPFSANHQVGEELLSGQKPAKPSEGLHSLPYVKALFQPIPPLLRSIIDAAKI